MGAATCPTDDPHPAWLAKAMSLDPFCDRDAPAVASLDAEQRDARADRIGHLFDLIFETEPRTLPGALAALRALAVYAAGMEAMAEEELGTLQAAVDVIERVVSPQPS